jgi:hypothetical protein
MSCSGANRHRRPVFLLTVLVLIALAGYLYSPWHTHDSRSASTCPFSGFEHNVLEQPESGWVLAQQTTAFWMVPEPVASTSLTLCTEICGPRAPPFSSSL